MDKHELIVSLKEICAELGRTPSRAEFIRDSRLINPRALLENYFNGHYHLLIQACGVESFKESRKRDRKGLTNAIFNKDIVQTIEEYIPSVDKPKINYQPTLIIPDVHFPFENKKVLQSIYEFALKHKPVRIIQVGDLYDMYAHSKFPRSHNIYMPKQEEELARAGAEKMWNTVREICPKAECIQLLGNHDLRPLRQTLSSLPSLEHVIEKYLHEVMTFEGVKLIKDPRQEYLFDDVEVIHGYRSNLGGHRDHALMNAICGHIHVGGVVFRRIRGQTLWELNCGLAGDPEAKAFNYTPQKIVNWTPGFGFVDQYGPRFIPL